MKCRTDLAISKTNLLSMSVPLLTQLYCVKYSGGNGFVVAKRGWPCPVWACKLLPGWAAVAWYPNLTPKRVNIHFGCAPNTAQEEVSLENRVFNFDKTVELPVWLTLKSCKKVWIRHYLKLHFGQLLALVAPLLTSGWAV
eukprot:TRINITY_DN68134_c2_g1_i1.p1 TRINITY_DN68134_c2_g1~~TRINITY_DN68134_c2_g1_i1.p1  ORF type:complete len:140 (+),score=3.38 TRINITY_DN68134_c2_g1_i1:728-1147(+)